MQIPPPPPPPPPPYTSLFAAADPPFVVNAAGRAPPAYNCGSPPSYDEAVISSCHDLTADGPRTAVNVVRGDKTFQELSVLQQQIELLRGELHTRLAPHNSLADTSPLSTPHSKSGHESDEWRHLLLSQQRQLDTISKTLHRVLASSATAGTATASSQVEEVEEKNEQKLTLSQDKATSSKGRRGEESNNLRDLSIEPQNHGVVDLVQLLTSFYNIPPAQCWHCREQLPNSFGEELLAEALGTTSRDLMEQYISLLIRRLNEEYTAFDGKRNQTITFLGFKKDDDMYRNLGRLPLPVLQQVLERTQFPSEIPAYRIAFAACEVYHQNHFMGLLSSRSTSFVPHSTAAVTATSSCQCNEKVADMLLRGVRFLWLPIRFLEDEVRRCAGLGLSVESSSCTVYTSLFLRLRQAIRLKKRLREMSQSPARHHLPQALTTEGVIGELRRVRPSYRFLTRMEKEQILNGEGMGLSTIHKLQERCETSLD